MPFPDHVTGYLFKSARGLTYFYFYCKGGISLIMLTIFIVIFMYFPIFYFKTFSCGIHIIVKFPKFSCYRLGLIL